MFEKKALAYILYITLLEIREEAYRNNDSRLYYLTDIMHNIPFSLLNEESSKLEYEKVLLAVESLNIQDWFQTRMNEFKNRFPEFG